MNNNIVIMSDIDETLLNTPQEEAWYQAAVAWDLTGNMRGDRQAFSMFYPQYLASVPSIPGATRVLTHLKNQENRSYFEINGIPQSVEEEEDLAKKLRSEKDVQYSKLVAKGEYSVFEDVLDLLLEAKISKYTVLAVSASRSAEKLLHMIEGPTKSPYDTLYDIFDAHELGVTKAKAKNKYGFAYNNHKEIISSNGENVPIIVFEDGPNGVKAAAEVGFDAIGICRKAANGDYLSTIDDMINSGAKLALLEEELEGKSLQHLIYELYSNQA